MKPCYYEGTWFAIPLRRGGYGVGVVARAKNKCALAYFFAPRLKSVPKIDEISNLRANVAIAAFRVGDLGLLNGDWPIIGNSSSWNRDDWPMPIFIRREPITLRNWLVIFSDTDPTKRIKEIEEPTDRPDLRSDSLYGYGAAEIEMTKILCD
jgi:hypothetical protein